MTHSLLHIFAVQSYGQSGGSEIEALQEAYRQINSSAGECEDGRAEAGRTPLSLSSLQPVSTVESGQTQHLAHFCQSLCACLRFKPFDLQLSPSNASSYALNQIREVFTSRFVCVIVLGEVLLADSKQLDFAWGCHSHQLFFLKSCCLLLEVCHPDWIRMEGGDGLKQLSLTFLSHSFVTYIAVPRFGKSVEYWIFIR